MANSEEVFFPEEPRSSRGPRRPVAASRGWKILGAAVVGLLVCAVGTLATCYSQFVIDVPVKHMAVLIKKTGHDLKNGDEIAPDESFKGVQIGVLTEGRYVFQYDPYNWSWEVIPQLEIPNGKVGVRVRLYGDDLPPGELLAKLETQKGIVPGVLQPGRHAVNPYLYKVEVHDPVTVPAGYKGVKTNLTVPIPTQAEDYWNDADDETHRKLLVKPGFRGVEKETLDPGTYPLNPFEVAVNLVDCRNQRFNLSESKDLGFPSKDGFWVSLDSIVEFRVNPAMAAKAYVLYNEEVNGNKVDEEVVRKVILPAARSFCRLQGSNNTGREFIQGRTQFQENYQATMKSNCDPLGIEIIQALITKINPPQQIAKPVQDREIAKQKAEQYTEQIKQQKSEIKLAIEQELVKQKQALVTAEQSVIRDTTQALREQQVAVTKGEEKLAVAKLHLDAAKDESAATKARGEGAAEVVKFKNAAEAAGWKHAVEAFEGDGNRYAQFVLYEKLAGAYRNVMINTADSPLMKVFETFQTPGSLRPGKGYVPGGGATAASPSNPSTPPAGRLSDPEKSDLPADASDPVRPVADSTAKP